MSSYGSMSPSEEGCEHETAFFCQSWHSGSPMDGGVYWPAANGEGHEYDAQESYHDNSHYISRNYGYEDMQMTGNEPYDSYHHGMHHGYPQNNTAVECDMQLPLYERPATSFVRVVKRRSTANKKERRRTQSINTAFSDLRECIPNVPPDTKLSKEHRRTACINSAFSDLKGRIPNVPPDTKLSKIKTLRLATSYISYLLKVLETDGEPAGGFRADLHHTAPRRRNNDGTQSSGAGEKRGKGRTGWPQHVWALELKSEQNLQT